MEAAGHWKDENEGFVMVEDWKMVSKAAYISTGDKIFLARRTAGNGG